MNNKFNFYRIEHNQIKLKNFNLVRLGPYSALLYFLKLDIENKDIIIWAYNQLQDKEKELHNKTINVIKQGYLPPALWNQKYAGAFEDPFLRTTFMKNIKNYSINQSHIKMKNLFIFGANRIYVLEEWFDFLPEEAITFHKLGFVIAKYHVDNIVNGLHQSISAYNENIKFIEEYDII